MLLTMNIMVFIIEVERTKRTLREAVTVVTTRKIPRLEAMTDLEAVRWYNEVSAELVSKRIWDDEDERFYLELRKFRERLFKWLEAAQARYQR